MGVVSVCLCRGNEGCLCVVDGISVFVCVRGRGVVCLCGGGARDVSVCVCVDGGCLCLFVWGELGMFVFVLVCVRGRNVCVCLFGGMEFV